jgi:hypothetical protein
MKGGNLHRGAMAAAQARIAAISSRRRGEISKAAKRWRMAAQYLRAWREENEGVRRQTPGVLAACGIAGGHAEARR